MAGFCFVALFLAPIATTALAFPAFLKVYGTVPASTLALVIGLGFGWGVGCTLAGVGYALLGVGLGMTLNLGLTTAFGSLLPFAMLLPRRLLSFPALTLYGAIALVVLGLALCAYAGTLREKARKLGNSPVAERAAFARGSLKTGVLICILAGLFSSMYNLSLVFGQDIRLAALKAGASPTDAVNILWLPVEVSAFAANFVYCGYLLSKNHTWNLYLGVQSWSHSLLASLMGILWVTSISIYGLGAAHLGAIGPILGFPVNMAMTIVAANVCGLITGEWVGSPPRAFVYLRAGAGVLIAAMAVIGVWQANSK